MLVTKTILYVGGGIPEIKYKFPVKILRHITPWQIEVRVPDEVVEVIGSYSMVVPPNDLEVRIR